VGSLGGIWRLGCPCRVRGVLRGGRGTREGRVVVEEAGGRVLRKGKNRVQVGERYSGKEYLLRAVTFY